MFPHAPIYYDFSSTRSFLIDFPVPNFIYRSLGLFVFKHYLIQLLSEITKKKEKNIKLISEYGFYFFKKILVGKSLDSAEGILLLNKQLRTENICQENRCPISSDRPITPDLPLRLFVYL